MQQRLSKTYSNFLSATWAVQEPQTYLWHLILIHFVTDTNCAAQERAVYTELVFRSHGADEKQLQDSELALGWRASP